MSQPVEKTYDWIRRESYGTNDGRRWSRYRCAVMHCPAKLKISIEGNMVTTKQKYEHIIPHGNDATVYAD